jgi:hypothetical protein
MLSRAQCGEGASPVEADRGGTFERKNRRERIATSAFPAAGFSYRNKEEGDEAEGPRPSASRRDKTARQMLGATRRRLVAGFVARTGIGVTMPNVSVVGGAGQANHHAVVMDGSEALWLFRRLG